jgi:DNA recombination protein RmuC
MFIPNESAYIAALQGDSGLWDFAYKRRIMLMSPTHLITSLKMIENLWKREHNNRDAEAIAERGGKLYDKFVLFVKNLDAVGNHINGAQDKFNEAYKQLNSGNDNLVLQATKLEKLSKKNDKKLAKELVDKASEWELLE